MEITQIKKCETDKTGIETCKKQNIISLDGITSPFDIQKSITQGVFIRDNKIDELINLLKNNYDFKFEFKKIFSNVSDATTNYEINNTKDSFKQLIDVLNNINEDGIYFIYARIIGHVGTHIIIKDKETKDVYIYEPHLEEYPYMTKYKSIYKDKDYNIKDLPSEYILEQRDLPLCYMYSIYFFFVKYYEYTTNKKIIKYIPSAIQEECNNNKKIIDNLKQNGGAKIKSIECNLNLCDNFIIMRFTRDILKLLYENKYVKEFEYYLLTDNIYKIINMIENINSLKIEEITGLVCSETMYDIIEKKINYEGFDKFKKEIKDVFMANFKNKSKKVKYKYNLFDITTSVGNEHLLNEILHGKNLNYFLKDKNVIEYAFFNEISENIFNILARKVVDENIDNIEFYTFTLQTSNIPYKAYNKYTFPVIKYLCELNKENKIDDKIIREIIKTCENYNQELLSLIKKNFDKIYLLKFKTTDNTILYLSEYIFNIIILLEGNKEINYTFMNNILDNNNSILQEDIFYGNNLLMLVLDNIKNKNKKKFKKLINEIVNHYTSEQLTYNLENGNVVTFAIENITDEEILSIIINKINKEDLVKKKFKGKDAITFSQINDTANKLIIQKLKTIGGYYKKYMKYKKKYLSLKTSQK